MNGATRLGTSIVSNTRALGPSMIAAELARPRTPSGSTAATTPSATSKTLAENGPLIDTM